MLLLLLAVTACGGDGGPFSIVTETPSVPITELLASPEVLQTGQQSIEGWAYLWQNYSFSASPDHRMRAVVNVFTQDSTSLSSNFRVTRMWVVNESAVWETSDFEEDRPNQPPYQLEKLAIYGPEWATGTLVDVIVRVKGVTGKSALLLMPGVLIVGTA